MRTRKRFTIGVSIVVVALWSAVGPQLNDSKIAAAPTPAPQTVQFSASSYSVGEAAGNVVVTVNRAGDISSTATVDYATSDTSGATNCSVINGVASSRCDYLTRMGTLNFAANETSKSISIAIVDDSYAEGNESFSIALTNPSGATLGSPTAATVTIIDNETTNGPNPIDTAGFLVRQTYLDFLNREPDQSGFNFWVNQIASCNGDAQCVDIKRQNVSAAFFLSREFQETGFYVIRMQRAAFGKISVDATKRITFQQFLTDARTVGNGFIDLQPGADQILDQNKTAYAQSVAGSASFIARFPTTQTAAQFVDALYQSAGVTPQGTERQDAINVFGSGDTIGRAAVLRKVSESTSIKNAEFSPAFVLLQYFGYLRRNPTDAPDFNDSGYQFWLNKLTSFGGDYIRSEMVRSFILSGEYRQRFGP